MLLVLNSVSAQESPGADWIVDRNGCKFLDPSPGAGRDDGITWSGGCADGYLQGIGELVVPGRSMYFKGEIARGMFVAGELRARSGIFVGSFGEGNRPAEGILTRSDGATIKGVFSAASGVITVEMAWPNGSRYQGQIITATGVREGRGKLYYGNGSIYEGEFRNDTPDGHGLLRFNNGAVYEGEFAGGEANGKGRQTFLTGDVYEGDFVSWQYQGRGKLEYARGDSYEGEFVSGEPQGKGLMRYADGSVYEGEFLAGEPHGQGKRTDASGDVYQGQFVNGLYHGKGTLQFANGASYTGDFVSGNPHGRGTMRYANGDTYDGEFVSGQRHGLGRYVGADSLKEGEWKANELDGKCKAERVAKFKYEGQCAAGVRSGYGHYEDLEAGIVYDGNFVNGVKEGFGKQVESDGSKYEGEFARDTMNGHGVLSGRTPVGWEIHYEGMFVSGSMEGQGVLSIGPTRMEGDFKANTLYRGQVVTKSGRRFEVDVEKGSIVELLPDGSERPADKEALDEIGT
jgi:hypothetical protein